MPQYPALATLLKRSGTGLEYSAVPYLLKIWLEDYQRSTRNADIVQTNVDNFDYLFDIKHERLIAAWGISRGRHGAARDKSRMAGHPLGAGDGYHRGHAIAHTLGGTTDINLVPQLGSLNIGAFRELERLAVATPGALYFSYWSYDRPDSQKPVAVQQGLLCPGADPEIREHTN